jgi:DNA repair protein SbcD/Mre11
LIIKQLYIASLSNYHIIKLSHSKKMRLLHTADWHLGQKFIGQNRDAEQRMALDWLLQVIEAERIEVLIVAGDIFDVHNPPVDAEDLYYGFLTRLRDTGCRHVVIIAGNHDSPARLQAPRGVLKALQIYVVGAVTGRLDDLLLTLNAPDGTPELRVAAIPFLRDRDFRLTTPDESTEARIKNIQEGIGRYYAEAAEVLSALEPRVPILATGHLFASGASANEEQHNIYLGNLDNIRAEQFPAAFDYVSLGHIHRAQTVGKQARIRYSGSLIPLSFSELDHPKCVLYVEMGPASSPPTVRSIEAPVWRRLLTIRGTLAEAEAALLTAHQPDDPLPAWIEIILTDTGGLAAPDQYLRDVAKPLHMDILKIRQERTRTGLDTAAYIATDLASLSTDEVFDQCLEANNLSPDEATRMRAMFRELKEDFGG